MSCQPFGQVDVKVCRAIVGVPGCNVCKRAASVIDAKDGAFDEHDCTVTYKRGNRTLAVATIFRDRASLEAELAMERA